MSLKLKIRDVERLENTSVATLLGVTQALVPGAVMCDCEKPSGCAATNAGAFLNVQMCDCDAPSGCAASYAPGFR